MASDVYSKLLTADVVDNGTIVFAYKAGRDANDYSSLGHSLYSTALQTLFPIADAGIGVVFGETDITVTYKGSTTIPINSKVSFGAVLEDPQTEFGDWVVDDLDVGGDLTVGGKVVGTLEVEETLVVGSDVEDDVIGVVGRGAQIYRFHDTITLATDGETTPTGLDVPGAIILSANIRVATQVAGLASADNEIELTDGTTVYASLSQGGSATTIAVNKKGGAALSATPVDAELDLVIADNSGDRTPSAGAVEVEVIYLLAEPLADVV